MLFPGLEQLSTLWLRVVVAEEPGVAARLMVRVAVAEPGAS
jgi:hypothetical protein